MWMTQRTASSRASDVEGEVPLVGGDLVLGEAGLVSGAEAGGRHIGLQ